MTQTANTTRIARLSRLAVYLERGAEDWRAALADPAVARALHARFGPAVTEIEATRRIVADVMAAQAGQALLSQARLPQALLSRLHDGLANLALLAAHRPPAPRPGQDPLPQTVVDLASRTRAVEIESSTRKVLKKLRVALLGLGLAAGLSLAMPVAAGTGVGDTVVNPVTGSTGVIVKTGTGYVLTDNYWLVFTSLTGLNAKSVTDGVKVSVPTAGDPEKYVEATVIGVTINAGTNLATSVKVKDKDGHIWDVVTSVDKSAGVGPISNPGGGPTSVTLPTASDDKNVVQDVRVAGDGSNGRNGGGFKVFGVVIGVSAGNGGPGVDGESFTHDVPASTGLIEVKSNDLSGIEIGSVGGGGGRGGDAVFSFGIDGGTGGKAGKGGDVNVTNRTNITTDGTTSHGMHVFSRSGAGGVAGTVDFGVAQGGVGGAGNGGGHVVGVNYGSITTKKDGAIGLFVQSLGGQSGAGGSSYGFVGIPGSSLQAGTGGTAEAYNYAAVTTGGKGAHGVAAQSIGGTGGNAGDGIGLATFSLGDDGGGEGGNGGYAKAVNGEGGFITTSGKDAYGLMAQSIGGGGGDGGYAGGLVGLGSKGGAAGDGGTAEARLTGNGKIVTTGVGGYGIFAQSIGGGGGNGGVGGGLAGIGGKGAGGGKGGQAIVVTEADTSIITLGDGAHGIFAESVGKGGGVGGTGAGVVGIGGDGDGGGDADFVQVTNAGDVTTTGKAARGIFAQSTGGGGGAAAGTGGLVSVGGSAAKGGIGGRVVVNNSGTIRTGNLTNPLDAEVGSDGIFAQSLGGGGGAGAASGGLVSLGGKGGGGGAGGQVDVGNTGIIITRGARARGIFAQSVGGGGGTGGDSGGLVSIGGTGGDGKLSLGGQVTVDNDGAITTYGAVSSAIQAQSVGGGGGDGGTSGAVLLSIGGKGKDGGEGGLVKVYDSYNLITTGKDSHGIFAQSVGGGGGNGGSSTSISLFAGVSVGGSAGKGGNGGNVVVDFDDRTLDLNGVPTLVSPLILTQGDRAMGIFAESVGGGGGNGGFAVQTSVGYGASFSVAVGGSGGDGGKGGLVKLSGDAIVRTQGDFAPAIYAESVGGGGGNGGFSTAIAIAGNPDGPAGAFTFGLGGSGGKGGDGDKVDLKMGGGIYTVGGFSPGLIAQSVGGGGGNGGFNVSVAVAASSGTSVAIGVGIGGSGGEGGKGGVVDVHYAGDITTAGYSSTGALVQSVGGGGGSGGFNVTAAVGLGTQSLAASVGLGGSGGKGGNADSATGIFDGTIETGLLATPTLPDGTPEGELKRALDNLKSIQSAGLVVQSVGGGGGSGGFNISGSISGGLEGNAAVAVGLGGSGGSAGNGGIAKGESHTIITHADQSPGFLVQSVGGGGGVGGMNISGSIAISQSLSPTISIGLGGAGGGGGSAEKAQGKVTGHVATYGADSDAIVAQSLGGGGGTGGLNVSGGISLSGKNSFNLGVSLGGAGGKGGDGGVVDLRINEGIANSDRSLLAAYTEGERSNGVLAQSLGGGGGNGGISVAGGLAISAEAGGNIMVGVGGAGGGAGIGKSVVGLVNGNVLTRGTDADAVVIQSIGGAGGNGGINVSGGIAATSGGAGNLLVGVGGVGGKGGNSGVVKGTVTGDIQTGYEETVNGVKVRHGDDASGVTIQSLGGGGGNGGINVTGGIAVSLGDNATGNLGIGVGGFAGDASNGTSVTGSVTGNIQTYGNKAYGILMQSAGGAGGNGGINVTGGIAASAGPAVNIGLGLGGFGGKGGHSVVAPDADQNWVVQGVTKGDVVTWGNEAFGAAIQSMGGGGGLGGVNVTGNIAFSSGASGAGNIGLGVGGFGGGGGNAGNVRGDVTGTYQTHGDKSTGVIVQSVGGGGGNGGINVSGNVTIATGGGAQAGGFSFGLGGFGGSGGYAGKASLVRAGDTETWGKESNGIFVQSVGGGGGNGAINVSGDLDLSKSGESGAISIGIGGFGGGGKSSGIAEANVTGNVAVHGTGSGVIVQSVGGGGGNGGINITGQLNYGKTGGRGLAFGLGGFGGDGGDGNEAHLTLQGPATATANNSMAQIVAVGEKQSAVLVQSVGGGGGNGAFNITGGIAADGEIAIGLGGFGGDGGVGRLAEAHVTANLFASGQKARGMLVQSVGGGGGDGGFNITAAGNKSKELSLAFGLGGFGGDANRSGDVVAWHRGQISVDGLNASGLVAQSVAGGGGDGGLNVALDVNLQNKGNSIAVGVGGNGGDGANAGRVDVNNVGSIFINAGDPAHGIEQILTQQITDDDAIKLAEHSHALLAQSVGGGGGEGGVNITAAIAWSKGNPLALGVGGSGGTGGNGGVVNVSQGWEDVNGVKTATPGTLRTYGEGSIALLAQSVGGGGGDAGFNLVVPVTYSSDGKDPAKAAVIAVGGSGAGAGYGDTVTVDHRGNILTGFYDMNGSLVGGKGNDSGGILAQSIGGGGGNANLNLGMGLTRNASALALNVGGATGAAGKGGKVNVYHDGNIFTWGNDSTAIIAQSIGGGGGNTAASIGLPALANDKLEISIGRLGGKGGEGDEVYINAKGTLSTQGERSDGIFAQSVGGGGGRSGTTAIGGQVKNSSNNETVGGKVTIGLEGGEGAISKKVEVHASGYIDTWGKDSYGIHGQSLGGGGGVGGLATNSIMRTDGSLNIAIGGDGGKGAKGGEVKIYNAAEITTRGENAAGIFAQSIGGGGGTGGNVLSLGIPAGGPKGETPHMNMAVAVGGSGGEGAVGNIVYVENSGIITTSGKHAAGIRAESIGGGGGWGGSVLSFRADTAKGASNTMSINLGGDGGDGGIGDMVTVWNRGGSIWTDGEWSAGISAASIGGGGGEGGGVADFQVAQISGEGTSGSINVNMGGQGGKGGKGGEVNVTNDPTAGVAGTGQIVTTKDNSYGIFAQSLGGGGGNGGAVFSALGGKGSKDAVTVGLNIGGSGDDGGTGGHVNVINRGLIDTTGASAHGILAQSIGGGGGNGAMAIAAALLISAPTKSPLIAIGGSGGDGGNSGLVEVNNSGSIVTRGKNANGIFAQSIGGGGGNSTTGFSASGNPYTFVGSNALAALIGALTTGDGGIGGEVKVTNTGNITTLGEGSAGIVGESINGGGGHLVLNFDSIETLFDLQCIPIPGASTCIPGTGGTTGERPVGQPIYSTTLGSTDSSDMNAGKVTIVNTGTIASGGANSVGMAIRSVGGGGGKVDVHSLLATTSTAANPHATMPVTFGINLGALNAKNGTGSAIDSKQTGTIYTAAGYATGLRLQSIGGGGGEGTIKLEAPDGTQISTVDVKLGATSGTHLEGGTIGHIQDGAIATTGSWSTAAHIQSIGGGGGTAMVDINAVDQSQLVTRAVLGADGGSNLGAGAITGDYDGLQTSGAHSVALLAQSIGGGGGTALTTGSNALDVKLGGKNSAAGDGGSITLGNSGLIQTTGAGSHAVMLQSIGGGGGAILTDATTITLGLNSGNSGNGGAIIFNQTGDIVATGAAGNGLIAQSLGGGGGWVDGPNGNTFAGTAGGTGKGGAITLTLDGGVFASGAGAAAIFAQSLGSLGGGDIAVNANGLVRGNAAGIRIDGGVNNTVNATGSVSAVSGLAINTGSGNDRVSNTGLVVGNIDLGSGNNAFNNQAGATFVAISRIDLSDPSGNGNNLKRIAANAAGLPTVNGTFSNDGDFLMGLSAGRVPIDLAHGATFANLDANGAPGNNLMYGTRVINTVELDGNFVQSAQGHMAFDVAFGPYASDRVNVTGNTTVAGKGDVILTWLENTAPVTLFATAGTATDNGLDIKDTLAINYRVIADSAGIKLALTSDFGLPFLNRNGRELGRHLDSAITLGGSGGVGRLAALIGNLQVGDESLYAGVFQELNPEPFLAPQTIQLDAARQFAGDLTRCNLATSSREHCVWAHIANTDTRREGDDESFAWHGNLNSFESGFETRVDDKWSIAGAMGYGRLDRTSVGNGRAQMEGDSLHAGVGVTRTFVSGSKLDLSLTTGLQTVDTERLVQVFGPEIGTATPHSAYLMARARYSHTYERGALFVRPAVGLAVTSLHQGAFTEQGLDGLGVVGVSHTQTFATLTPDLTVGYKAKGSDGGYTALSFNVGAVVNSTDRLKMPYRLAGANANADPAQISTAFDPSSVRYGANVQVVGKDDKASLNLSISNEAGKRYSQQTFSVSARFKF